MRALESTGRDRNVLRIHQLRIVLAMGTVNSPGISTAKKSRRKDRHIRIYNKFPTKWLTESRQDCNPHGNNEQTAMAQLSLAGFHWQTFIFDIFIFQMMWLPMLVLESCPTENHHNRKPFRHLQNTLKSLCETKPPGLKSRACDVGWKAVHGRTSLILQVVEGARPQWQLGTGINFYRCGFLVESCAQMKKNM